MSRACPALKLSYLQIKHVIQAILANGDGGMVMSNEIHPDSDSGLPMDCQIRIEGHLGQQWVDWFDGLTITLEDTGATVLTGRVVDQAALHGLLKKVRDLGMPLLSVVCMKPSQVEVPDAE